MGLIYKATSPSGKVYIGQTNKILEERKCQHKSVASRKDSQLYDTKFSRAIRKYGFDNLKWEIIERNISKESLNEKEIYYVLLYDSFKNGYNSTAGGEGHKAGHSLETRIKISRNHVGMIGREHSEETKRKMSKSNGHFWRGKIRPEISGPGNPMYGKSEERSPVFRQDISFDKICKTAIDADFKRNKTAKLLNCNRSTVRNRIFKRGFRNWSDFCLYIKYEGMNYG